MVPARRILVVENLGNVQAGDHLIMVANVIVAHDTSRQNVAVPVPRPPPDKSPPRLRKPRNSNRIQTITRDAVYDAIKELGQTTSMRVSDHLKLARNDGPARSKVSRMILSLVESKQVHRQSDTSSLLSRLNTDYE
jgi:hypothetical protein